MQNQNRNYGKERVLGDIIYNPNTKSVFTSLNLGFLGKQNFTLKKNQEGGYGLLKSYKDKQGNNQEITLGKFFPIKNQKGEIVEGLTKGTFGLFSQFDKQENKTMTKNNDCLILVTHKLQEPKELNNSGFKKVGWITGQFAIENEEVKPKNSFSAVGLVIAVSAVVFGNIILSVV